ncbi:MAG: PAS domain-containing protein [Anaerolineae bacterium]|nr:PAS domain-containing protein [Anaerolineae bacterium]
MDDPEREEQHEQSIQYGRDLARVFVANRARRRQLVSAYHLLDAVFTSVPGGLVVTDEEYFVLKANAGFCKITGVILEDLLGRPLTDVLISADLSALLDRCATGEEHFELVEVSVEHIAGRDCQQDGCSLLVSAARIDSPPISGWVIALHDQTAHKRLSDAFGRYVNPDLAKKVVEHGVDFDGQLLVAAALICDIREYTALTESMSPRAVVSFLNRYFSAIEPVLEAEHGRINDYGGDALLAVFGAPIPSPDHVGQAVRAALAIRETLAEFNIGWRAEGHRPMQVGIGIDVGEMVAGTVGSPRRMQYTVVGDPVNTASRIEGLNKLWGTDILISERVYEAIRERVSASEMPLVEVPGKSEPLQVYALHEWLG